MYSIYVRDILGHDLAAVRTLAVDVPNRAMATMLVRSIATSYPVHLHDPFDTSYWFRDRVGSHEIWYEEDHARSERQAPSSLSPWEGSSAAWPRRAAECPKTAA